MAHTSPHGAPDHGHVPPVNHEVTDVPLAGITRVATLSLVIVGIIMAAIYGMWGIYASRLRQQDTPPPPMADKAYGSRLPQMPRLQSAPSIDLAAYRRAQREKLSTYGWVDKGGGVVHIPIDRAIELMAERASTIAAPQQTPAIAPGAPPGTAPAPKPAAPKPAAH